MKACYYNLALSFWMCFGSRPGYVVHDHYIRGQLRIDCVLMRLFGQMHRGLWILVFDLGSYLKI